MDSFFGTHRIGSPVGSRAGPDTNVRKGITLLLPGINTFPARLQLIHSLNLCWL